MSGVENAEIVNEDDRIAELFLLTPPPHFGGNVGGTGISAVVRAFLRWYGHFYGGMGINYTKN